MTPSWNGFFLFLVAAAIEAPAAYRAANKPEGPKLELRGRVTGVGRLRMIHVTLFGVESSFAA